MSSFDDYKEMAKERGSLAFETYLVLSKPLVGPEEFSRYLPDHLAYIQAQERAGHLVMAGPLSDETGADMSGIGMQIWRAENYAEALSFASADPMHIAGVKEFELRRWLINEGNLQLNVGLSSGTISL